MSRMARLVAMVILAFATPARSDEPRMGASPTAEVSVSDRLKSVEAELKKLTDAEQKRQDDAAKRPSFRIGGQIQVDALAFGQSSANIATVGDVPNVVNFRRARLVGRGEAFDFMEYAIGFDFALPGRPSFLDVFVGVKDLPHVGTIRAGHFLEPLSLERVTLNRYHTFLELAIADAFTPVRNTGVCAFNTIGSDRRGTWALGAFASNSDNYGDQFTDVGGAAVTARTTFLPYYDEASEGRYYLHVGAGYSCRTATNNTLTLMAFPEARAGAPGPNNIPPFVNTGAISADGSQIANAEVCWTAGPLSVQAEYFYVPVDQIGGPSLAFHGGYAYASFFLTGEHRTYNKDLGIHDRISPRRNFLPFRQCDGPTSSGWGAWEVAARFSFIDLTDKNITGGVENNFALSLNWYLNPYTRVKAEYIFCDLDRPPVGDSNAHIFGLRLDFDF